MTDPRHLAAGILGEIEWQNEVSGFCRCPGETMHTKPTRKKDCRVSVDGAPTIYCFHSSCAAAVAHANQRLRRALGEKAWQIRLPGGRALRNGDVLRANGAVVRRETATAHGRTEDHGEMLILETLTAIAERFKPELHERFRWPFEDLKNDSPVKVSERDADEQFRAWLKIWPAHSHIWIGDVYNSGKLEYKRHFRPVAEWHQIGPVMGNFTCGSSFKPGSFSRSNENCNGIRFVVVESDILAKDEIGAVFGFMNRRLHFSMHAVIDTAGKSLHGWFDAPRNRRIEGRLKAMLAAFGCDPKMFTYSQPVRVPGAYRQGKMQRLVWIKE